MHKYDALYVRWKKYTIKKKVKIFFIFAAVLTLGYMSYTKNIFSKIFSPSATLATTKTDQKTTKKESRKIISSTRNIKEKNKNATIKPNHTTIRPHQQFLTNKKPTNIIYPSFDFEKNLFVEKDIKKSIPSTPITQKNQPILKKPLIVSHTKSLSTLKKEFETKRSSDVALLIAKKYYAKKDFKNTIEWSLLANDIDPSNEESWLLFAKAKYRLGEKNAAIRALQSFVNLYNSERAKMLLKKFQSGEFR